MLRRTLTVRLQHPATAQNAQKMVEYEVAVIPLSFPSSPEGNSLLLSSPDVRSVLVGSGPTTVIFELVPTDNPTLTERLPYRLAYREKYMGKVYTKDFVMPDFDVDFDDLESLGNLIGSETYLLQSDLGIPGRVARLNDQGEVVNSSGVPVGMGDAVSVANELSAFKVQHAQDVAYLRQYFLNYASDLLSSVYRDIGNQVASVTTNFQNDDAVERGARTAADVAERNERIAADAGLSLRVDGVESELGNRVEELEEITDGHSETLLAKADLVGGKVPSAQLPAVALGQATVVADEAAMLALTSSQVQPGDLAVRPDGTWILNTDDPSQLENWVQLAFAADVTSVNSQTGAVVLSAADVGARASAVAVPLADVEGLGSALDAKATTQELDGVDGRVTDLENDTTIVRTSGGLIDKTVMPDDSAFITESNLVAKKDGTVLNLGGEGGTLDIADVEGLQEALDDKVEDTDSRLSDARTPTTHASTHATGGSDPVTASDIGARPAGVEIPLNEVTGLEPIVTGNNLGGGSNHGNRIGSLEQRVNDLEGGEPGGGTGVSSAKTVWWNGLAPTTDFTGIILKSPFGFNGSGYYYDPAGAAENEAVYPFISENGHLIFREWNETNPPDPVYATQSALEDLSGEVSNKVDQGDFDGLEILVSNKASQSDLNSLSDSVLLKASQDALDSLSDLVDAKASALTVSGIELRLQDAESALPDKADLAVDGKLRSDQVPSGIPQENISGLGATLGAKADLINGKLRSDQVPSGIPQGNIDGLGSTLGAKADLINGKLRSDQVPSGIPQGNIDGLGSTLGAKADLINGKVPTVQLPSLALTNVVTTTSRPSMLALTTNQVQPGDVCVITAGVDQGSYILTNTDPSVFANWTRLVAPQDAVSSVNGQTGAIVLTATDVGARSAGVQIPQADVANLGTALSGKVDVSTYESAMQEKLNLAGVRTAMSGSVAVRQRVDYVATSNVTTSGQVSIDGFLVSEGARVLLTAQTSSVNNGIWVVNASSWTRPSDYTNGDYFLRGTLVFVADGQLNQNTVWQVSSLSGVVGTNASTWTKILTAAPAIAYTASQGVERVGSAQVGYTFQLKTITPSWPGTAWSGGGVTQNANGVSIDTGVVARRAAFDVPAGSTTVYITHNFGTQDVSVSVYEKASGNDVLVAATRTGLNQISLEFAVAPTANQYRCVCIG